MKQSFADRVNHAEFRRSKPITFSTIEQCTLCGFVAAGLFYGVTSVSL